MNDFIEKTYNLINFRYLILIFQKYSLTCPKGGQNASLYLEMSLIIFIQNTVYIYILSIYV